MPRKQKITTKNIIKLFNEGFDFTNADLSHIDWGRISELKDLSEKFIKTFDDNLNFDYLFCNYKFSSDFLKDYINSPDNYEETIIETQKLSLPFIKKFIDLTIFRHELLRYQNLSEHFILKNFKFKITIDDIYSLLDNKNSKCNIYKLCKKLNIDFKKMDWGILSKKLTKICMAYDAQHHSNPELFDEWAKGGHCPYSCRHMLGNIRQLKFMEERTWWQPKLKTIKLPTDNQLFQMLIDYKRKELF